MKIIAVNGSPRKKGNTAAVLEHFLNGARDAGADARLVHLYDLRFTGCRSCFACKLRDGASYGRCAVRDDLSPLLEELAGADGVVLGSPIYFGNVTGEMRSFQERWLFPYCVYDKEDSTIAPRRLATACLYTMNVNEEAMIQYGYQQTLAVMENFIAHIFSKPEVYFVTDTCQFDDYGKYVATRFSETEKRRRRETVFPLECRHASEMGRRIVERAERQAERERR